MPFSPNAASVFADGPTASPLQPSKPQIRAYLTQLEAATDAISAGAGTIAKQTLAQLNGDLMHAADTMAWVYADGNTTSNGIYRKSGASGVGSWSFALPLPYTYIVASNSGTGTPNAIQATSAVPVTNGMLVSVNVTLTNTLSPVTIAFNSQSSLTIKTRSGQDVAPGDLTAGYLLGVRLGSILYLLSDTAVASLIYAARDAAFAARDAAQTAKTAAEAARDIAAGYASDAVSQGNVPILSTLLGLSGEAVKPGINYLRINGYGAAGDAPAIHMKRLASAPAEPKSNQWQSGDGAWWQFTDRQLNAEAFGIKADDATDNSDAWVNLVALARDEEKAIRLPPGIIRGSFTLDNHPHVHVIGDNRRGTLLKPAGSASSLVHIPSANSGDFYMEGVGVDTSGTSMQPFFFDGLGSGQGNGATLKRCLIRGDHNGPLIYSTAQLINVLECNIGVDGANTLAFLLENFNQNCDFSGNIIGGIGKGVQVLQTGGLSRVEGLSVSRNKFINTGSFNLDIGNVFSAQVWGNILDQSTDYAVRISDNATLVAIFGNYAGMRTAGVGIAILVDSNCGPGTSIVNNQIHGGTTGIAVAATASSQVAKVRICYNNFVAHTSQALSLDSVARCIIVGNADFVAAPTAGSYITSATYGPGDYIFDNNDWATVSPQLFDPSSQYSFGDDRGIVGRYSQTTATPSASGTAVGFNHGINPVLADALGVKIVVSPRGHVGGFWHTIPDSTGAAIGWEVEGTPTFDVQSWVGR